MLVDVGVATRRREAHAPEPEGGDFHADIVKRAVVHF
jgi:hypothetical protein